MGKTLGVKTKGPVFGRRERRREVLCREKSWSVVVVSPKEGKPFCLTVGEDSVGRSFRTPVYLKRARSNYQRLLGNVEKAGQDKGP